MKKIFEFLINYFLVKVHPKLYMRHTYTTKKLYFAYLKLKPN